MQNQGKQADGTDRSERIAYVVEEVIRRRAAGERVDDAEVRTRYDDLMPELGDRLQALHVVDQAERLHEQRGPTASAETLTDGEATVTVDPGAGGSLPPGVPDRIGHYAIKGVIASGGMGTVYEAVQDKPHRTVAVKIIKQGIASPSALRRFEYESHLLANLRHPGIAQVYEAGTHKVNGAALPFFAMEYIPEARRITEFAAHAKLSSRARLELSGKVCDAVHHGHQKGIIHRDLKPGNILVDSTGQPKIIDFGVARSTDSDVALTTIQTEVGQLIGTLQYMSPEQCAGDPNDIDTRSDVYALGVVLYELLCETHPYSVLRVSVLEAARIIRDQQPFRPSSINRTLRGDVETIVLKALEKDRSQRYQSAAELAGDIRRYFVGAAISARPPSMGYQLRVLVRRNKPFFGAIAALFVVLVGATAISTSLYLRADRARLEATRQRDRAVEAEQHALLAQQAEREQRQLADANATRAQTAAETASQVRDFMIELFYVSDPTEARGNTITAREILDKGADRIKAELTEQPEVQASLMDAIGQVYAGLGLYDNAQALLEGALHTRRERLPADRGPIAESLNNLGALLSARGNFDQAEQALREGASHPG